MPGKPSNRLGVAIVTLNDHRHVSTFSAQLRRGCRLVSDTAVLVPALASCCELGTRPNVAGATIVASGVGSLLSGRLPTIASLRGGREHPLQPGNT